MTDRFDYVLIGAGIVGLSIAYTIKQLQPAATIAIVEKEATVGEHASGRNSGVIHAGFYYTADSLKAKLCREGNLRLKQFCAKYNIDVVATEKLVVAKNAAELEGLEVLLQRGLANGVPVEMLTANAAREIEPKVRTFEKALYSPSTASVNPKAVCTTLVAILEQLGVEFFWRESFVALADDSLLITTTKQLQYKTIINTAGLFADIIASKMGYKHPYVAIPFKGLYLKYLGDAEDIRTNIYPVPNLNNPFLGVHFTKTFDGSVKIGPTAIPALWRENYGGLANFNLVDAARVIQSELSMALNNNFNFTSLAIEEIKKYSKKHLIKQAMQIVAGLDSNFASYPAGIRAQLFDTKTRTLAQDFVVVKYRNQIHILNAVSPAFTCCFAFASYVVNELHAAS